MNYKCVHSHLLLIKALLLPKLGETSEARLTLLFTRAEQLETRQSVLETTMSPGVHAGLIDGVQYTMRYLGRVVHDRVLLGVLLGRLNVRTQFVFQSGVLNVEAIGQIDDTIFKCFEFFRFESRFPGR